MRVRTLLMLIGIVGLFAVPVAVADDSKNTTVAFAKGNVRWTIPLPNAFGVEVGNHLWFNADKHADGSATGRIHYAQTVEGETVNFKLDVTCMGIYDDGTRVKVGGVITKSNDPTVPVGRYGWFQLFDLSGSGLPDRSTLIGIGDEAANEAFCASPNPPRFGPWDVKGDIRIRT